MKKIIKLIKNNTLLGFILGISLTSIVSVSAVTYLYSSNQISYSNSNSSVTDVKGAIDELYDLADFDLDSIEYFDISISGGTTYNTEKDGYTFIGTGIISFNQSNILLGRCSITNGTNSFVVTAGGYDGGGSWVNGSAKVRIFYLKN